MGFGPEYNNRSSFGESLDRCEEPDPPTDQKDECDPKSKPAKCPYCGMTPGLTGGLMCCEQDW